MALSKRGISHLEYVSVFLAELFGTALLVFLSCSSCIKWMPDGQLDSLQICLSCGFAVLISVQIFGCVSGAHINPCVTVAAAIYNIISVQVECDISFRWSRTHCSEFYFDHSAMAMKRLIFVYFGIKIRFDIIALIK